MKTSAHRWLANAEADDGRASPRESDRQPAGVGGAEAFLVRSDERLADLWASARRAAVTSAAVARSTMNGSIGVR